MASAIVTRITSTTSDGTNPICEFEVVFTGSDVTNRVDISMVSIPIIDGETLTLMKNRLSGAVSAEATRIGYTLAASRITLPAFTRG